MLYFVIFVFIATFISFSTQCPDGWRQSEVFATKCYLIVKNKKNWFDAENYCKSAAANAHLTSITSAFEQANINAIVSDTQTPSVCGNMWIGANDIDHSDVFTWTDGMPFSYRRWGPGQPDLSPDKLCVAADARSSDIWSTNNCGDEFCFICESYSSTTTTTQQPSTIATSSSSSTTSPSSTITVCTTPPPTISPPFPCQRNIIILFDSSNGMNANQYLNQTAFISYPLFTSSWTFDETNVALAAYDDTDPFNFRITGAFGTINNLKQAQNALHISQYNDAASITTALKMTADPTVFAGATPCVKQATVLFTSTSVQADILSTVQYAQKIRANGPLIIVAMGPNAAVDKLNYLTSSDEIFAWPDYNNVPADLAKNITQAMCSPPSTGTPILPTGTSPAIPSSVSVSAATSSSTSLPTTSACTGPPPTTTPPNPCQTNVIFLIDASDGVTDDQFRKQTSFIESIFQMNWTYNEINIAIGEYSDPLDIYLFAQFGEVTSYNSAQNVFKQTVSHYGGTASLTAVLQKMNEPSTFTGSIACVQKAVVLFTSTSIDADVTTAQQYADGVKKNGPLIIVAMGPNASASKLSSLASPTPVIQWPDYNNVPADLATNIIQAMCSAS